MRCIFLANFGGRLRSRGGGGIWGCVCLGGSGGAGCAWGALMRGFVWLSGAGVWLRGEALGAWLCSHPNLRFF